MIRRLRGRTASLLVRTLGFLTRWPRLAFAIADTLAAATTLVRRGPHHDALRTLFPDLPAAGFAAAIRRIRVNQVRRLLLHGWAERAGVAALQPLVRTNDTVPRLQPPLILATFHVGPLLALTAFAERLDGEVLALRSQTIGSGRAAHVSVGAELESEQQRSAAFLQALARLRRGGFVFMAVDPLQQSGLEVPFLGRTLRLARGAFALSRMTGVPIVPVVAGWNGDEVEVETGEALHGDDERTLAAAAAQWLERYLTQAPGELSHQLLALMEDDGKPQAGGPGPH
ncbi:MAG TPA: hypothetical protein VEK57_20430 [Thermoanaerobaculia bacterium]|nr:hypothetical protein [Thermoanaerobaculia bacterium]